MSAEAAHFNMHEGKTHRSRIIDRAGVPVAKAVPLVRRVNRTAIGSLAGQVDLSGDWDSPETDAAFAEGRTLASRDAAMSLYDVDPLKV